MAFFSPPSGGFSAISQPKMRQEGFHLPSPSPSAGHPPSPPPGPFDLFLAHSSHHAHQGANNNNDNRNGNMNNNGNGLPSLALPDAFSRTSAMDLTDELAMSLMNPASPATSNERSTHTPPANHNHNGSHSGEQAHMHNIFDISAPHSSHYANGGAHAFSLPHSSHRPDLPPLSQPASLATSHLHGHYDHHSGSPFHHTNNAFNLGGRDPFPAHFNSTIPPLSSHHDPHSAHQPPPLSLSASTAGDMNDPFAPFTPTSASSIPARESMSPQPLGGGGAGGGRRAGSRSTTTAGRSPSRSRSRVRPGTANSQSGGGPTRTTKSTSRRRDSFTLPPHLSHSHSHSHSHSLSQSHIHGHLHSLPSPPLGSLNNTSGGGNAGSAPRPSSIVIPSHGGPGGALSPLGNMGGLGSALSPLGPGPNGMSMSVGQASGWFGVDGFKGMGGVNINGHGPGSVGAGEFSLPTPDSVGHGPFGTFGTSVGSMGISPKDTVASVKDDQNGHAPLDPASKQAAIVNEKRRRRRESHNAVERRRRDNINEKISELATLIPEVMLDPTAGGSAGGDDKKDKEDLDEDDEPAQKPTTAKGKAAAAAKAEKADKDGASAAAKANKGMILRKSVEYIRYLQQLVGAQAARNRALEARLQQAGLAPSSPSSAGHAAGDDMGLGLGMNGFGEEMGLHSFEDRMDLGMGAAGMNGFGHFGGLEPMAEMEMDMDMEDDSAARGGKRMVNGASPSEGGDERERDRDGEDQDRDGEHGSGGSPGTVSDASSPQDQRDASSDRSEERTGEREERGRRGRDGKVPVPASPKTASVLSARGTRRRSKLLAVKEEGAGMEV